MSEIEKYKKENLLLRENIKDVAANYENKIAQLSMIKEMGSSIIHAGDFKEGCRTILETIIKNTPAQNCSLMLFDERKATLFLVAATAAEGDFFLLDGRQVLSGENLSYSLRKGEGIAGKSIECLKTLVVEDVHQSPEFLKTRQTKVPIGSLLSTPLVIDDKPIGVLNLSHGAKGVFSQEDINLFDIHASFIAIMIRSTLNREKLLYSEERYRALVECSSDGIAIIQEGRHCYFNPRYREITGLESDQLLETPFEDIIDLEASGETYQTLAEALGQAENLSSILRLWVKNSQGEKTKVELNNTPFTHNGKPAVIVSLRDLTIGRQLKALHERVEVERKASQLYARNLIDSSPDIIVAVDRSLNVIEFNKAAQDILGYGKEDIMGLPIETLFSDKKHCLRLFGNLKTLEHVNDTVHFLHKNGARLSFFFSASILYDGNGDPIGYIGISKDITIEKELEEALNRVKSELDERVKEVTQRLNDVNDQLINSLTQSRKEEQSIRNSLREKEVYLKEIHHRVKNNLQIISSILELQSEQAGDDSRSIALFQNCKARIRSMAMTHEMLYQSENLAQINYKVYVRKLLQYLLKSYGVDDDRIQVAINVGDVHMELDTAIPCGLIINELVSNSLKHAFPGLSLGEESEEKKEITVSVQALGEDMVLLEVCDNGIGIPQGIDFRNTDSLGLQLVTTLAEDQLHGRVDVFRNKGTKFVATVKVEK